MNQTSENLKVAGLTYEQWTLTHVLQANLEQRPDHLALQDANQSLTYRQLWEQGTEFAAGLAAAGVSADDRVLTMLDNSVDWALTLVALNFLGAVAVPANTMHRGTILTHVVSDSQARVAIVEAGHVDTLARFDDGVIQTFIVRGSADSTVADGRRQLSFSELLNSGSKVEPVARNVWDPAIVGYTSGTTGASKGILMTNAHLICTSDPYTVQGMHGGPDEVVLIVAPMFHLMALGGLVAAFIVGGTTYIAERFSASGFIATANEINATHTLLVSAMADFIMQQPAVPTDAQCTLRTAYVLPVPTRHEEFSKRFGIALRTGFGATEVGGVIETAVADANADGEAIRRGSSGMPRPGMEVRLVDEHDIEVPVGTPGECVVRHRYPWTLCIEYQGNPEATALAWRNGWFHTGDLLNRDPDGYYYFVDRKKDAIRRRGENVSSLEIEREVLLHDDVDEVSAVAVDMGNFEQEIKIVVVRRAGSLLSEEALTKFLIDRLPRYAVPRFVKFIDELPRTPTMKVRKELLRQEQQADCWDREAAGIVVPR